MSTYVDGFVLPLARDKVEEYRRISHKAGEIWREHGALAYHECIGEDLDVEGMLSFRQLAGAKPDETVVFAWIVYPSRAERDRINAQVMADPRLTGMGPETCPFDSARMAYGGFQSLVAL